MNVGLATTGILLTAPVMALAAVAIRMSSPGPVIFRQARVGYCARAKDRRGEVSQENGGSRKGKDRRDTDTGGRLFTIYKFRTMTVATQAKEEWATPDDPRITTIGRFLRRTRIDELPQLFNVLKGDMNIVGPRPEQPGIFAQLRHEVDHYAQRQKVKPGITGLAQVNLDYDQSIDDVRRKVRMDLRYIQSRGIKKDLEIMTKTVPVMLFKKGSM
ncbi:MAG: sugar transferase [Longimicrobiales bacterium]